jgi:hypothetical protein
MTQKKRCPNGTRKNKNGDCVEKKPKTQGQRLRQGQTQKKKNLIKNSCIRNKTTNRCQKSFKKDETSVTCKLFQRSQRCRGIKEENFVIYKNYKIKKNVKSFLEKNVVNVPLASLIASAKKDPDYEYGLQFLFENKSKTEPEIKQEFEEEILDLSHHHARDHYGSDVITMKSIKYVLNNNREFNFLLK